MTFVSFGFQESLGGGSQVADPAFSQSGQNVTITDTTSGASIYYTLDGTTPTTSSALYNGPINVATYVTLYTYDWLDHLIKVSMPRLTGTQTRTFNYNDGAFLVSATNPENGTVSYTYDSNNRLATKIDAKGQKVAYTYDSYGRNTLAQRYYPSGGSLVEDTTQATTYYYDSNPFDASYSQKVLGRLAAVQYNGGNCTALGPPRTGCDTIQEMYSYSTPGAPIGKRLRLIRGTAPNAAQGDLNGSWTFDGYGRVSGVTYPQWTYQSQFNGNLTIPGSNYSYSTDTMSRFNKMHDQLANTDVISAVTYGVANEELSLTGILNETRTYNTLFQLTRITVTNDVQPLDIQYAYSTTQNNGKLTSQTDVISGEQVTYTYDTLNRLATAVTTDNPNVTQWGQSYTYDGFGNLTDQNVIKGSAPTMHVAYNVANNRQTGDVADANGNIGSNYAYDIGNRLLQPGTGGPQYAYDPTNKRVWRGSSSPALDEITFWSPDGNKLASYQISVSGSTIQFALNSTTNVYFGGRLIAKGTFNVAGSHDQITLASVKSDRLGSIGKFYPYGQERPSATTNDTEKFTGYYRDASTGLDYADQRYHQPGAGRFMTPDPDKASAGVGDPGSWNRYAYVGGDPVNKTDSSGLEEEGNPDGCYVDGMSMDTLLCPGNPIIRPPATCATQFCRAQSNLLFAQALIAGSTGDSDACEIDLAKLTVAANDGDRTASPFEINFESLRAAISQMDFQDGTVSSLPVSALYAGPAAAAGDSFQRQQDRRFGRGQTIGNLFARSPGLSVSTVFDGSTAFINPNLISNFPLMNMGLLFHEALHTLGMDDEQIQKALGLTVDRNNTVNITNRLTKDCAGQLSFSLGNN